MSSIHSTSSRACSVNSVTFSLSFLAFSWTLKNRLSKPKTLVLLPFSEIICRISAILLVMDDFFPLRKFLYFRISFSFSQSSLHSFAAANILIKGFQVYKEQGSKKLMHTTNMKSNDVQSHENWVIEVNYCTGSTSHKGWLKAAVSSTKQ